MREFVITVNSTIDMPKEWLEENDVSVIPLKYVMDGKAYVDMKGLSHKEFFEKLRQGLMPTTSQVNPDEAKAALRPYVEAGKDVLHLAFSSALSGTCHSMKLAAQELAEEYPMAKIMVVDTLCACMGEGLLLHYVLELKKAGKDMDEIVEWVEKHKLNVCHLITVDDLNHLHRGGRVSKATAIVGSMVKIKPILHIDNTGAIEVVGKERGRKKSLHKIVEMAETVAKGWDNEIIMITHGDCIEEANYVAELAKEKLGTKEVLVHNVGTVIGSHTGPGVVAVFCMGNKR